MVIVAQLVRAPDCGSGGRRFESGHSPTFRKVAGKACLWRFAPNYILRGCVKRFLPPSAAEFSLDGDLFFMISRSEIMKNKSPSKYYLAQSAKKNLYAQPLSK